MSSSQVIDNNYIKLGQLYRLFQTANGFVNLPEFKAIVENDFDVNYKLPTNSALSQNKPEYSGNTLLHIVTDLFLTFGGFKNSCLELLLKLGADLTITNDKGYTPLLLAFYEMKNVNLLLEAHFESNNSTNIRCKNGISHFHIICSMEPDDSFEVVKIVDFFLKAGAPVNERVNDDSPIHPGYTPLHFAAKSRYFEVIELLLSNGANINNQDIKGITPLQVLIENFMVNYPCIEDIESIEKFLMKAACNDQHDDVRLWLMYFQCILHSNSSANQLQNQEFDVDTSIKLNSMICPGYTPLHLASHLNSKTVISLLLKGANLLVKDAKGVTPLDICLKKMEINGIIDILANEKQHNLSQLKFTDGTYLLEVLQAMTKQNEFAQFLRCNVRNVNAYIPFQSLVWPGYNFLHLAVLFDCCVPNLLSHKADFTMINMDGLSPLHLAFRLRRTEVVKVIISAHRQIPTNPVNRDNISHLHIACAEGDITVANLLLRTGADPNLPMLSDFAWYCNDHYLFIKTGFTPLHIAVSMNNPVLIKILLDHKANPHVAHTGDVTPFQIALSKYKNSNKKDDFTSILKQMLEIDLETWITGGVGIKTLHVALTTSDKPTIIVERLVQELDKKNLYEKLGLTRLQVASCIGDLTMVQEELKSGAEVNQCISFDSSVWPGDSAMHILFRENPKQANKIAELLLAHGADLTLKNATNSTPIHVCKDEILQTAISLLSNNFISVNPVNNVGLSHFHLCCKTTNVLVAKKFLKSGVNINTATDYFANNYAGWTPLHFAICYAGEEVVKLLLNHGADHKITNADGLPPLHQALFMNLDINSPNRLKMIIRHPAVNVQDMSIFGKTILMTAITNDDINENIVNLILNLNVCINLKWFTFENLYESNFIFKLANDFSPKIFKKLISFIPAITATDDKGQNAFHYFSLRFTDITNESYFKDNIEILIKNGCEVDQKDKRGETALHNSCFRSDDQICCLLLSLGADINMKNDDGNTPIEYAFDSPFDRIKSTLVQHMQKLEEVGMYLEESNIIYLNNEDDDILSSNIKSEMKILDYCLKEKISSSFSSNYFFTEQFVVDYRRMPVLQREKIRNFCESRYVNKRFSNLLPLINHQLRKARTRTRLLEPAQNTFNEFVDLVLPNLCLDIILNYLRNEDLMNLIRAKSGELEFAELPKNC